MFEQLLIAIFPLLVILLLIVLPAILSSLVLVKRDDLTSFQLWSLFLISWLVPIIGPLAALIATSYVIPKKRP